MLNEKTGITKRIFPDSTDLAAFQMTSGTTADPRICVWQHQQLVTALGNMAKGMKLDSDDVCLSWVPLYHDMGLIPNFLTCLTRGIPLAVLGPADFVKKPVLWLRGLYDTRATITWSPNFGFALATSRIQEADLEGVRLDHVRGFWNAAEKVHLETIDSFYKRFAPYGVRLESLKTNFGLTENVGGVTYSHLDGPLRVEQIDKNILHEKQIAQVVTERRD